MTRLERGLRLMLTRELGRVDGPRWERALPNDVKEKIDKRGLAYSDFPDLKKILASSWRKLELPPGAPTKQLATAHLEGLEPVRNDLAHSRDIPPGALSQVQAAYHILFPLFRASDSPVSFSLPPTSHRSVAVDRIVAAITNNNAISPEDLSSADIDSLRRQKVEDYVRVRERPGREPRLMNEVRKTALLAIKELRQTSTS
jgi:hypothetical protein